MCDGVQLSSCSLASGQLADDLGGFVDEDCHPPFPFCVYLFVRCGFERARRFLLPIDGQREGPAGRTGVCRHAQLNHSLSVADARRPAR